MKLSESIPTLSELRMLAEEGIKADVILIDFERDTKLFRLKSLINKLAGGLNPNPAKVIKKIAGVVRIYEHHVPIISFASTTNCVYNTYHFVTVSDCCMQ